MVKTGDRAFHKMCGWTIIEKVYKATGDGWYARGTNGFYAPLADWTK